MSERLEKLKQRKKQIEAQIRQIKQREAHKTRRENTRKKILLGALLIKMMNDGQLDRDIIMERLDKFLTKDIDRKLFDFPIDDDKTDSKKADSNRQSGQN